MENFCAKCGAMLGRGEQVCPRCGSGTKKKKGKLKILAIFLMGLLVAYSAFGVLYVTGILDFATDRPSDMYMPPETLPAPGSQEAPEETPAATEAPETIPIDPFVAIGEQCQVLEKENGVAAAVQYLQSVDADKNDPRYGELLAYYQQREIAVTLQAADALAAEGRPAEAIRKIWDIEGYAASEKLMDALTGYFRAYTVHTVAAGRRFTGQIREEGTVVLWGYSEKGPCDTSQWNNIESIALGDYFVVGLTYDGTVVASGPKTYYNGCQDWTDISILAAGDGFVVGLKKDGTLVANGHNGSGQLMVDALYGDIPIVSVAAGYEHTVALRADGTVTAIGRNNHGQCEVSEWTDIVAIAAGSEHTVGLKADGTVVATGANDDRQCAVGNWNQVADISAGDYFTMGLQMNGTVVAVGKNNDDQCFTDQWRDVIEIAAGNHQAAGLLQDGTLINAGKNMGYG